MDKRAQLTEFLEAKYGEILWHVGWPDHGHEVEVTFSDNGGLTRMKTEPMDVDKAPQHLPEPTSVRQELDGKRRSESADL